MTAVQRNEVSLASLARQAADLTRDEWNGVDGELGKRYDAALDNDALRETGSAHVVRIALVGLGR